MNNMGRRPTSMSHPTMHQPYVGRFTQYTVLPQGTSDLLHHIYNACKTPRALVFLTSDAPYEARQAMIPAAGWLLGYPVVYALDDTNPSIAQAWNYDWDDTSNDDWTGVPTCLVDVSLYLITVQLRLPASFAHPLNLHTHTLLAFTVPGSLPNASQLVQNARGSVHTSLLESLRRTNRWNGAELTTHIDQVAIDRVAL